MFCDFTAGDFIFLWFVLLRAKYITPCPSVGPRALRRRPSSRTGFFSLHLIPLVLTAILGSPGGSGRESAPSRRQVPGGGAPRREAGTGLEGGSSGVWMEPTALGIHNALEDRSPPALGFQFGLPIKTTTKIAITIHKHPSF